MACDESFVRNDSILVLEKTEEIVGRRVYVKSVAESEEPWLGLSFPAEPRLDLEGLRETRDPVARTDSQEEDDKGISEIVEDVRTC
jgi:hypothetical protein